MTQSETVTFGDDGVGKIIDIKNIDKSLKASLSTFLAHPSPLLLQLFYYDPHPYPSCWPLPLMDKFDSSHILQYTLSFLMSIALFTTKDNEKK